MKSLWHNGVYVPQYDYKGLSIKIRGKTIKLSQKTEQMAVAFIKKVQSSSPPDKVFYKNFMQDFLQQLRNENPQLDFLGQFQAEYLENIDNFEPEAIVNSEIDFSEVSAYLEKDKMQKQSLTKAEKKKLAKERKIQREALKKKFGYAIVNGRRIEIANWTAEPSCLFLGRGNHPKRGRWKEGPKEEDIILNLSPDAPKPPGNWKAIVWEPDKMYIAKWRDKLTGKMKYVWFSDSAFLKQRREYEKFKKAEKLGKLIPKIEEHIFKNLEADDDERRKIATVCWLILALNMRVGDEKDPGEADTVGAITLRPEHIRIDGETLHFDFLGKDSVRWMKSVKAPQTVIKNIEHYAKTCREYLFEGINSKKVSRFLSEKMKGLTAKVFRTWRTTGAVKEYLEKCGVKREDAEYLKQFHAKMANLEGAKIANHKRKVPDNFEERLAKKELRLKELMRRLEENRAKGKKIDSLLARIEKAKLDIALTLETKEWNLATSLKSYIDPRVYVEWAAKVEFNLEKLYPKNLRKKFRWALKKLMNNYGIKAAK
ncbi:MAG: DNA topoisomerase I [Nitrososphaerota archaeon]|nr:DNA topoisomerase I [Candidatus Bathyarchaeota archaeon]MDW8193652.1 DNA topoisomerase I [Nitrososphaerota archaeon]